MVAALASNAALLAAHLGSLLDVLEECGEATLVVDCLGQVRQAF